MTASSLPQPVGRQAEVLYLPAKGNVVVLGTAGSGKTTLAILRSLYLSHPSTEIGGRTLLVAFGRPLVTYMKHLSNLDARNIVVENYHRFARGYLSSKGKQMFHTIGTSSNRQHFIYLALGEAQATGDQAPILQRPSEFFDDEFQWIQRNGIESLQDYVAAQRIGRSAARVARAQRPVLWDVYTRYLRHRHDAGILYDWDDLATAAIKEFGCDTTERRYRHVVIDEGQDFSPEMLRSLAAAIPSDGSLTFLGDIAQQIYGHGMSWRSAGLVAPDIWRLGHSAK